VGPSRPSGPVTVAGVIAIIGSCLAIFGCAMAWVGITMLPSTPSAPQLPPSVKSAAAAAMLFFLAVAVFGVFTGVGILRLKNWARISAMIWAALVAIFGSLSLVFALFVPLPSPPAGPSVPMLAVRVLLFVFYGIPVAIGIWWLILFNRPAVRAQFAGTPPVDQPVLPKAPRCPLPVAVIAGFLGVSFVLVLLMALAGFPFPVLLFGHVIRGQLGAAIFALTTVLTLASAIGLWKLKRWSYPLLIGLQLFWLASGAVTFLSSSYEQNMREIMNDMQLPQTDASTQIYLHGHAWTLLIGLLPSIAMLAILLYYRVPFWEAAEAAEKQRH